MNIILGIGIIMLIGFLGGRIASFFKLPSLTGYIIFGLVFGPYVGRILPEGLIIQLKNPISLVAVSIIAFMLGGDLTLKSIKQNGLPTIKIAVADSLITFSLVLLGLYYLAGQAMPIAIPLAALAVSPAPTVVVPIVKELRARGHFTNILLMISALEDITCVICISMAIAVSRTLIAGGSPSWQALWSGFGEVIGSVISGLLLGFVTTITLRKLSSGNSHLLFTLAMILAGAGITTVTPLSALITVLTMGVVVFNYSRDSRELFAGIEKIANPIMLLFFTTAGATLKPALIPLAGIAVLVYIAARLVSKFTGVFWASKMIGMERKVYRNLPACLLSQAGTTIGLTMIVAQQLPEVSPSILTVMLSAVIFFEIIAPPLTRNILIKLGEAQPPEARPEADALQISDDLNKDIFIDEITQIYNDLYFNIRLNEEMKRAKRYTQTFSLLFLGTDSIFTGTQERDIKNSAEKLRNFGQFIKSKVRATDILSQLEPGVFALMLPETNSEGANFLSERLKEQILLSRPEAEVRNPGSEQSLRIDTASYPHDAEIMEELIYRGNEIFQFQRFGRS